MGKVKDNNLHKPSKNIATVAMIGYITFDDNDL